MVSVKFNAFPYTLHYFATSLKHSERHSTTKRLKSLNIYRKSIELWYMLTTYCRCPGRLLNLYRISCPHQFWYFSGSLCRYCFLDFKWSLPTPADPWFLSISCGIFDQFMSGLINVNCNNSCSWALWNEDVVCWILPSSFILHSP